MLTAEELRRIRRLTLQAGRRVDSLFAGGYRSAFRGRGMEFDQVRAYVPGDDVRHIDWNVTARSSEAHVKEFHEERELTLLLAVDVSASMDFGAGGADGLTDKRRTLARLGGALAYAAIRTGDRVGMLAFTDHVERFVPPRRSRGHAWRVIREVYGHRARRTRTDLAEACTFLGRVLKRRAVVVIVSDFLSATPYGRQLAALASRHTVHGLLVWDPLEQRLPDVGLVAWEDAETGEVRLVDAARVAPRALVEDRVRALRRMGVRAAAVSTAEDPFLRLVEHFHGAQGGGGRR